MKKLMMMIILCTGFLFFSCTAKKEEVQVIMPDGTPALALANVLDQGFEYGDKKVGFQIVPASEIAARISQDACDIGLMPTTAAAQLYKKGVKLRLASVNVFGNLFITGTKTIEGLEDLKGNIVLTTGATTLQMVQYVLNENQIPYEESSEKIEGKVALSLKSDASEIIPSLKKASTTSETLFGVLGEPQVTMAQGVISNLSICVDLQEEYKKITGFAGYPQAGVVIKEKFFNDNPDFVEAFLTALEQNQNYLQENLAQLPKVFERYESNLAKMTFTLDTIKRCNLRVERAAVVKSSVVDYIKALIKQDISDDFFLI